MKEMMLKDKLPEVKSVRFDLCEGCIMKKQRNLTFPYGRQDIEITKSRNLCTQIYWDPYQWRHLEAHATILPSLMTNDFSGKMWAYLVKNKSKFFQTFKN